MINNQDRKKVTIVKCNYGLNLNQNKLIKRMHSYLPV